MREIGGVLRSGGRITAAAAEEKVVMMKTSRKSKGVEVSGEERRMRFSWM